MPAALAVDWNEIRKASEGGVDDDKLAESFGVNRNSLRARRMREKWLTPAKIAQEAIIQQARDKARTMTNSSAQRATSATGLSVITENLTEIGQKGSLHAGKVLLDLILAASADTMKPLADVSDLSTAAKTLRTVAGLDKAAGNVQVSIWSSGPTHVRDESDDSPVFEA